MKTARRQFLRLTSLLLALLTSWLVRAQEAPVAGAADDPFMVDLTTLAQQPHRLHGTPAVHEAADYLAARWRRLPGMQVVVQGFASAQMQVKRCELVLADGRVLPLVAMRPNGIILSVTPPAGLSGRLLYLGQGGLEGYGEARVPDSIVVLDYNSGAAWLRAFALGAKAVIFVNGEAGQAQQALHADANANLPRAYFAGPVSDLPMDQEVTLHSELVWTRAEGRNVLAMLPGTDPVFDATSKAPEAIVIAAPLDSYGEVPWLSPGARGAANLAGLLAIGEHLQRQRPRRHVILAAFDNQARSHAGAIAFYRALESEKAYKDFHLSERLVHLAAEKAHIESLAEALARPGAELPATFTKYAALTRDLEHLLKPRAADRVADLNQQLMDLRTERAAVKKAQGDEAPVLAKIALLQARKDAWNAFRRAISRQTLAEAFTTPPEVPEAPAVAELAEDALVSIRQQQAARASELRQEEGYLAAEQQVAEFLAGVRLKLHVSLLAGDATARWGLVIGSHGSIRNDSDQPGLYTSIQGLFTKSHDALAQAGQPVPGFELASADLTLTPSNALLTLPKFTHSGEIAGRYSIFNLALGTVQDSLAREGTPADSLSKLGVASMREQFHQMGLMLGHLASAEGLSLSSTITRNRAYAGPRFEDRRLYGPLVRATSRGASMADRPTPGVVIQFQPRPRDGQFAFEPRKIPGFDDFLLLYSNQNGSYAFGPVDDPNRNSTRVFAAEFDGRGQVVQASAFQNERVGQNGMSIFRTQPGVLVLPTQVAYGDATIMDARGNAALNAEKNNYRVQDGLAFWYAEEKIKAIKVFGLQASVALVNGPAHLTAAASGPAGAGGADAAEATGDGMPVANLGHLPASAPRAASDLWRLNDARLQVLRSRGVSNSSLEELHGRAEDLLLEATASASVSQREALANASFMTQRRAYGNITKTLDDLVRAVLILLALAVPFAFALERLLVGAASVYKQIIWFVVFFLLTFLTLYFTHPAFAIAKTPIIIFLGFAVVVLSAMVIGIIMRKFEVELKIMQGLESTVHAADVSRFSTIMAAMSMGISSMRRRPLRTTLTAITIILLTFTILCFASFGTESGIIRLFATPAPDYSGVMLRLVNWGPLQPGLVELAKGRYDTQAQLATRYWLCPETGRKSSILLTRPDGTQPLAVKGLVGISELELRQRPDLRPVFTPPPAGVPWRSAIWMTAPVADRLGLVPGARVLVNGAELTLAGLLDSSRLSVMKDMDDSDLLPVDFVEASATRPAEAADTSADGLAALASQSWEVLGADMTVFIEASRAQELGALPRLVTLYTSDAQSAARIAEDLARILPIPIAATRDDGVYRHIFGAKVQASGVKDLFFPILLGGLVIFGTMLGSVTDREKEIYTFSALGLAPQHVAGLFFAEALVYSVIGGLGGYLLAQASMKVLGVLAVMGLVRVPELNYSSMNAIVTILLVMVTVLISAIYPAVKASRSANPGIMRSWKLPTPTGDVFDLVFPFTVSEYDITGVVSFLKEHFDSYSDTGLGVFMAKNTELLRTPSGNIGLRAHLALAPFDLGVTQSFWLQSKPSEIPGIDEVAIHLERLSGEPRDWRRLNRVLLDDLRKQFLIWRSLPQETMEGYRQRTLVALGASVPPAPTATPAPPPAGQTAG